MMGKKDGQMQVIIMDIGTLVPENHLLRKIDRHIDFDFIYKKAARYYPKIGRPSIDPVCMVKMLLVGYLYGVKSERRLMEEVSLNLAYRWFGSFDLTDKIPDHSFFSQNRRRRFTDNELFIEVFNQIVRECVKTGIVTGEAAVSDGSFIPANAAQGSLIELKQAVEQSTVRYMDALDDELREQPGYREPIPTMRKRLSSRVKLIPIAGISIRNIKRGLVI